MTEQTFDKRFNAQRGARRALKDNGAREGIDFTTAKGEDGKWHFTLAAGAATTPALRGTVDDLPAPNRPRAPRPLTKGQIAAAADRAEASAKATRKAATRPATVPATETALGGETAPTPVPAPRMIQKYRDILEAATRGELPPVPDFSAETHTGYRNKLRQVVDMVERNDLDALMAHKMRPTHTSPKMIIRYRDFAIHALKVRKAQGRLNSGISQIEWERSLIAKATGFLASKSVGYGNMDERNFTTLDQAARAAVDEMGGRTIVHAVLPCGRRLPVGRVKRGTFQPTEAAQSCDS